MVFVIKSITIKAVSYNSYILNAYYFINVIYQVYWIDIHFHTKWISKRQSYL